MIVCTQCGGKGTTQSQNEIIGLQNGSTQSYHSSQPLSQEVLCTQCRGNGYQMGNGA